MLATDIKTVRDNPRLKLSKAVSLGWFGLLINSNNGPKSNNPLGKDPRVRQALRAQPRPRRDQPGRLQRRVRAGQPVGQPAEPILPEGFPVPKRDIAKAKALMKEAGVAGEGADRLHGDQQRPRTRAVAEVVQSMAAEAGFDLKLRVTEVATALKQARTANSSST